MIESYLIFLLTVHNLQVSGCQCINKVELSASDLREFHCTNSEDLETLQLGTDNLLSLDVAYCTRFVGLFVCNVMIY